MLFLRYRRLQRRIRGARYSAWIRLCGGTVGQRLEVDRAVVLRWRPHRGMVLGDRVYLGVGVVVDVSPSAELFLGDDVKIMHYSVLAASSSLRIGAQSQVAEHCSIRDADHGTALGTPMREQSVANPTTIGADVWVGRGVAVLRGSVVGDGAVIGANSVVRGAVPAGAIAVGSPVRVIGSRQ